jgi:hypothetical protein
MTSLTGRLGLHKRASHGGDNHFVHRNVADGTRKRKNFVELEKGIILSSETFRGVK